MAITNKVLLFGDDHDGAAPLQRLLTPLGGLGPVTLLVTGCDNPRNVAPLAHLPGVAEVWVEESSPPPNGETLAPWLAELIATHGFSHVATTASSRGRDLMPRLAAVMDLPMLSEGMAVVDDTTFHRAVLAGRGVATVTMTARPVLMTLRPSAFAPVAGENHPAAPMRTLPSPTPRRGSRHIAFLPSPATRVDLASAEVVVAGGQGVGSKEHFLPLQALAEQLGGAVGASRGAVDAGFAPEDWQIGQTGKVIAPQLYIAAGISGAIQHLAGIQGAATIIAINNDPAAPIFAVSDYGLVGDLRQVIPELLLRLAKMGDGE